MIEQLFTCPDRQFCGTASCVLGEYLHASRRFGLGSKHSEPAPTDTRQWLWDQLNAPDPLVGQPLPSTASALRLGRKCEKLALADMPCTTYGQADLFAGDMETLLRHAVATDLPVRERLVWFWANHFTASARAGGYVFGLNGAYVSEAIRPHVTGRFADLLKAVMRHPAMLYYLDNWLSFGPDSIEGRRLRRGINENLARECLELHTLGVDSGYTQRDVTTFALVLTGRAIDMDGPVPGFAFRADMHQPGPKTFLGHTFPEGFEGSEAALDFIADHPATHRHLAIQLVQHYVADVPPPACVAQVEAVLRDTKGDLKQAMLTIIDMPEAWQPLTKFRAPVDYIVSVLRALELPEQPGHPILAATNDLGQPFMAPLLPNGWPDTATSWISGEGLLMRADWAMQQAQHPAAPASHVVLEATLGDVCSDRTRTAVARCPNAAEALATVFASPEFQRR